MPTGTPAFIQDANSNVTNVTTLGHVKTNEVFDVLKPSYHESISSASGGSQLADMQVGQLYIQSLSGNSIMYIGGTDTDAPFSGRGILLYADQDPLILPISNANRVRVCSTISGQLISYWGFINGSNTEMDPTRQGTAPDTIPPVFFSSDPVSGASSIAVNGKTFLSYFSEGLDASSVNASSYAMYLSGNATRVSGSVGLTASGGAIARFQNLQALSFTSWYNTYLTPGITDITGNHLTATASYAFQTTGAPDTTPPTIASSTPASGSTGIALDTTITVNMSETCSGGAAAMTPVIKVVNSGNTNFPGTLAFDDGVTNSVFTFTPNADLTDSEFFSVKVSGIYDIAGNVMVPATIRFDTEVENAPVMTSSNPLSGASATDVNGNVVVYMDKRCSGAGGTMASVIKVTDVSGTNYTGSLTFDNASTQRVFTFDPTSTLPYFTTMTVKVSGIYDTFSNVMTPVTFTFTTGEPTLTPIYSAAPTLTTQYLDRHRSENSEAIKNSSSSLYGKVIKEVKVYLQRVSGTGDSTSVNVRIKHDYYNNDQLKATIGSISTSSISSTMTQYTFINLSNSYSMVVGDALDVESSISDFNIRIYIRTANDVVDGTNSIFTYYDGTNDNDISSQDLAANVYA